MDRLKQIGINAAKVPKTGGIDARDKEYDRLADHFENFIQTDAILNL